MKDTEIISSELYPIVKKSLDKNSKKFLANIFNFFNQRHEQIYDIAPYYNIYYNRSDLDKLYQSLGLRESDLIPTCRNIYYWDIPINPGCVKEPYVLLLFNVIQYYLKNDQTKNAELASIYLVFSGKFYASLFSNFWKYPPGKTKQVMDFVINNMLSDKFDLKKEGNLFKAIQKLCATWIATYRTKITKNPSDDDVKVLIQQLRDRLKSFLKNIADLFYEAYKNKLYLNYETDSLDPDNFRLTDNDAATALRITEATMNILTSQKVDLEICKACKNENVSSELEIKDIVEAILNNNDNLNDVRRVVNILICDFMSNFKGQRVGSVKFVSYSLKAKPNTQSKILLEMKSIVLKLLEDNSVDYRRRAKSRIATKNNYYRSVLGYFVWTIVKACER